MFWVMMLLGAGLVIWLVMYCFRKRKTTKDEISDLEKQVQEAIKENKNLESQSNM